MTVIKKIIKITHRVFFFKFISIVNRNIVWIAWKCTINRYKDWCKFENESLYTINNWTIKMMFFYQEIKKKRNIYIYKKTTTKKKSAGIEKKWWNLIVPTDWSSSSSAIQNRWLIFLFYSPLEYLYSGGGRYHFLFDFSPYCCNNLKRHFSRLSLSESFIASPLLVAFHFSFKLLFFLIFHASLFSIMS